MNTIETNNIDSLRGKTEFVGLTGGEMSDLIKVVGVGGGGGNAVTTMFNSQQVKGVTFLLCNTDAQVLAGSSIPEANKLLLGPNTSKGLGAGNKPNVAREAAEESAEQIRQQLTGDSTRMVFITSGMGGGTGTGAAPVIGRIAQEEGLLTVGIVTIPFLWEGEEKIFRALEGVNELRKHVDALLVINNERLLDVYKGLTLSTAFAYADATLSSAAQGISDLVYFCGRINLDFADVRTVLKDSGVAIISSGKASGELRAEKAFKEALNSPLLNNNNVTKATRIMVAIFSPEQEEFGIDEMAYVKRFTSQLENRYESKFGYYIDNKLEPGEIRITILAAGFDYETTERSIRGVSAPETQQERERAVRDKELSAQAEQFYGKGSLNGANRHFRRPLLLSLSELDNEELILIAEESTALDRDLRRVEGIRSRHKSERPVPAPEVVPMVEAPASAAPTASNEQDDRGEVILFQ
ncbi:MAG: cell division protein FtsZ [Porphyromonas sp.]|nr:cell division protein FtsZ [Porphyromonas sp.]